MKEMMLIYWKPILEIVILWFAFYRLSLFIKGTTAFNVILGVFAVIFMFYITSLLNLHTINWILTKLSAISVVAFLVIFQPELRRGLTRLGQAPLWGLFKREEVIIDEIVNACFTMSDKRLGGIVAIKREIGFKAYIESGVKLDSQLSADLIVSLFTPPAPLHDGAIVVEGDRIIAAACLFPLTQNPYLSKSLGTRHRAAIGLTEETDAVCIIISEETGKVSIAIRGRLTKNMNSDALRKLLHNLYKRPSQAKKGAFRLIKEPS
ncbi:MAG: TIGR00159 family protein [Candidatus Omnitrophica bacterium CG1_02_49_10]|nr:MAG: TIGR00159 family protein [Candidatus Omnitrophica bacterium CG1_02_49_10]